MSVYGESCSKLVSIKKKDTNCDDQADKTMLYKKDYLGCVGQAIVCKCMFAES